MKQAAATSNLPTSTLREERTYIHPSCVIDPSVQLGEGVQIHANVVIDRAAKIGKGTVIHSSCFIGEECIIGENTTLYPSVTLREKTRVGNCVTIESGVVIGSDGFGYAKEQNGVNSKVPQVGFVVLEDNVRIGANSTIDRATLGRTVVSKGSRVGNLVQVGHNVIIGEDSTVKDGVGISGSCKIGAHVSIGQGVGMVGHIKIGDNAVVSDGAGISKDIQNGSVIRGVPGMPEEKYRVFQDYLAKLPELVSRIKDLEAQLGNAK